MIVKVVTIILVVALIRQPLQYLVHTLRLQYHLAPITLGLGRELVAQLIDIAILSNRRPVSTRTCT